MATSHQPPATSHQPPATSPNYDLKRRILYVTHYDYPLGANLALFYLMLDMRKRHNIEPVLLTPYKQAFSPLCEQENIQVIAPWYFTWQTSLTGSQKINFSITSFRQHFKHFPRIATSLKDKHFDLIHTNSSVTDIGYHLSKHLGIPHVWHIQEYGIDDYDLHYVFPNWYVRSKYTHSGAVVAISRSLYNHYIYERKLCTPKNTRIIYHGLEVPEAYKKTYCEDKRVNFCITGGLWKAKNQLMAIQACAKLKTRTDRFSLHIIGSGRNDYTDELKHFVVANGLEEHVKFWGFRSDVYALLKNMDVGLMLSKREAFGRVTVEYMMNYMPVIGVNTGATPEIIIDGTTGFICPFDDTDRLAELMHIYIENPELLSEMGAQSRELAVNKFSTERNTDEIYKLYLELWDKN